MLRWIAERCKDRGPATESAIGLLPGRGGIDTAGLDLDDATMRELLAVSPDDWRAEVTGVQEFFGKFGARLPAEMERQRQALAKRLG